MPKSKDAYTDPRNPLIIHLTDYQLAQLEALADSSNTPIEQMAVTILKDFMEYILHSPTQH